MPDFNSSDLQSLFQIIRVLRNSYSNSQISHELFPDEKEYIEMGINPYLNHAMKTRGMNPNDNSLQIFISKYNEMINSKDNNENMGA